MASQRIDFLSWRKSVDDIKNSKNNESIVMKVNDEIITKNVEKCNIATWENEKLYLDKISIIERRKV